MDMILVQKLTLTDMIFTYENHKFEKFPKISTRKLIRLVEIRPVKKQHLRIFLLFR